MGPRFEKIACSTMSSTSDMSRLYQLEQLLLKRLPQSVHMLNICIIAIQKRLPKTARAQFYGYQEEDDESWPRDGKDEFIVCIERPNLHTTKGIIILPPPKVTSEMTAVFDSFIGWDEPQMFQSIPDPFSADLRELCIAHKNIKPEDSEGIPGIVLAIVDQEKAKNLEVPSDPKITMRKLEQKDVPEVLSNWKWAKEHSEGTMRETIVSLASCGAFLEDGEMICSTLLTALGFFNVLYTPEKFRRKGYGQLVLRAVSKMAAQELGTYPAANCEVWNVASKRTMEKVGYEEAYRGKWFYFYPSISKGPVPVA